MDWMQFIIFIVAFVGLFTWNRAESRADYRMIHSMVDSIQKEVKDFHCRLCAIEERNKDGK